MTGGVIGLFLMLWFGFQVISIFMGMIVGVLAVIYVIWRTFFRPLP